MGLVVVEIVIVLAGTGCSGGNDDDGYHGDDVDDAFILHVAVAMVMMFVAVAMVIMFVAVGMLKMVTTVMMVVMLLKHHFLRMALGNYEHVATGFKVR